VNGENSLRFIISVIAINFVALISLLTVKSSTLLNYNKELLLKILIVNMVIMLLTFFGFFIIEMFHCTRDLKEQIKHHKIAASKGGQYYHG